ncbi:hypothetical protein ROA7450_00733 [Roseovarius albus]|uniref:Uncharacterized protein n=1 Tax=Roseovarius albus TaxID=1247867 RepID=A0A1X6YHB2_9RHOB|nr:hypothetical protein ROA7450_00733 [Roseovarius albus]
MRLAMTVSITRELMPATSEPAIFMLGASIGFQGYHFTAETLS